MRKLRLTKLAQISVIAMFTLNVTVPLAWNGTVTLINRATHALNPTEYNTHRGKVKDFVQGIDGETSFEKVVKIGDKLENEGVNGDGWSYDNKWMAKNKYNYLNVAMNAVLNPAYTVTQGDTGVCTNISVFAVEALKENGINAKVVCVSPRIREDYNIAENVLRATTGTHTIVHIPRLSIKDKYGEVKVLKDVFWDPTWDKAPFCVQKKGTNGLYSLVSDQFEYDLKPMMRESEICGLLNTLPEMVVSSVKGRLSGYTDEEIEELREILNYDAVRAAITPHREPNYLNVTKGEVETNLRPDLVRRYEGLDEARWTHEPPPIEIATEKYHKALEVMLDDDKWIETPWMHKRNLMQDVRDYYAARAEEPSCTIAINEHVYEGSPLQPMSMHELDNAFRYGDQRIPIYAADGGFLSGEDVVKVIALHSAHYSYEYQRIGNSPKKYVSALLNPEEFAKSPAGQFISTRLAQAELDIQNALAPTNTIDSSIIYNAK